jgi:hypothetical protein
MLAGLLRRHRDASARIDQARAEVERPVNPRFSLSGPPSDKDRAIRTAREVLKYEQAGITITPSETINLSREYLRALRIPERSP